MMEMAVEGVRFIDAKEMLLSEIWFNKTENNLIQLEIPCLLILSLCVNVTFLLLFVDTCRLQQ